MVDLDTLIHDLERATEGSLELDEMIGEAVGAEKPKTKRLFMGHYATPQYTFISQGHRHFTTSLSAALTLLPDGWWWEKSLDNIITVGSTPYEIDNTLSGQAVTPALAVCIAALKARGND